MCFLHFRELRMYNYIHFIFVYVLGRKGWGTDSKRQIKKNMTFTGFHSFENIYMLLCSLKIKFFTYMPEIRLNLCHNIVKDIFFNSVVEFCIVFWKLLTILEQRCYVVLRTLISSIKGKSVGCRTNLNHLQKAGCQMPLKV